MKLHPLRSTRAFGYTTFGCMWKRGECTAETEYVCKTKEGVEIPMQSRITAYWPDGSVKWTAHTADATLLGSEIEVLPGNPEVTEGMSCTETEEEILLRAGMISLIVKKDGRHLFAEASKGGKPYLCNAEAVLCLEEPRIVEGWPGKLTKSYTSRIESYSIEECGSLKTIIRFDGIHETVTGEQKLPFIIRMEAGYNNPNLKFTHTFLYDGMKIRIF